MQDDNNPRMSLDQVLLRLRYESSLLTVAMSTAAACFGVALLLPAWLVFVLAVVLLAGSLMLAR